MKKLLTFLFLFTWLFSCTADSDIIYSNIENDLKSLNLPLHTAKAVVIIPGTGCSGCITDAESLLLETFHKNTKSIFFILTTYRNKKEARMKLGSDVLKMQNVYFDKNNIFYKNKSISIYPIIVYVQKKELVLVSPSNPNAINTLKMQAN